MVTPYLVLNGDRQAKLDFYRYKYTQNRIG